MAESRALQQVMVGHPDPSEHTSYYGQYIALVPEGDIIETLTRQHQETAALLDGFDDERARWRPAPQEWNTLEIVGHLADTERIFAYRALRIARGDTTPLEGIYDVGPYVEAGRFAQRSLSDVAIDLAAVRQGTLTFLRGLDAGAWTRIGTADGSPVSVRALAYIIAGHELHHLVDLRRFREGDPVLPRSIQE